jgi:UPF0755 protein
LEEHNANVKRWRKTLAEKGQDSTNLAVDGQPEENAPSGAATTPQKKKTN